LQDRQFGVEVAHFLKSECESAPDIETIGKLFRRFFKQLGRALGSALI
jgi:hypothetical protein